VSTIGRYIGLDWLRSFLFLLLAIVAFFLVVDFFGLAPALFDHRDGLALAVKLYTAKVPMLLHEMAPVAAVLAVLIVLARLGRSGEIGALRAAGISPHRLSRPILMLTFLVTVGMFALSNSVNTRASETIDAVLIGKLGRFDMRWTQFHKRLEWFRGERSIYRIRSFNARAQRFEGVSVFDIGAHFGLDRRIDAASMQAVGPGQWELVRGTEVRLGPGDELTREHFDRRLYAFPEGPDRFRVVRAWPTDLSYGQVQEAIRRRALQGYSTARYEVALHDRLAYPFACLALVFLACAWGLRGGQGGEGTSGALARGGVLVFVYMITRGLLLAVGENGVLDPLVAAWLPTVVITGTGGVLWWRLL
jgi:lipopolysaccharide export system permease protein